LLKWLENEFAPSVKKYLENKKLLMKAVLVLSNGPTHHTMLEIEGIVINLLPPNVTPLIQPMDQGVILSLKRSYRKF